MKQNYRNLILALLTTKSFFSDLFLLLLLVSILCVPFIERPDLHSGLIEGKKFYLVATSLLLAAGSLIKIVFTREQKIQVQWTDILLIAFLLITMINSLAKNTFIINVDLLVWICCGLLFIIGKALLTSSQDRIPSLQIVIGAFVLTGALQAVTGILQLYGYIPDNHSLSAVTGNFFNPAPYAGYLVCVMPLAFSLFLHGTEASRKGKLWSYGGLAVFLLIFMVLPATWSRAGWVAGTAGCLLVAGFHGEVSKVLRWIRASAKRRIATTAIAMALILTAGSGLFYLKQDSARGRLLMWKVSSQIMLDHPLTGIGFGNYRAAFGNYQARYFENGKGSETEGMVAGKGEYAFNEWLLLGVEQGLIGLALFGAFIIAAGVGALKIRDQVPALQRSFIYGAFGSIAGLAVFACFSYPFSMAPVLMSLFLLAAILSAFDEHYVFRRSWNSRWWIRVIMTVPGFLLIWQSATWLKTSYNDYQVWGIASTLKGYSDYGEAIKHMREIAPRFSAMENGEFLFEYGHALKLHGDHYEAISVLEEAARHASDPYLFNALGDSYKATKQYVKAEAAYWHAYYLIPHKFYPIYLLANLYDEMGEKQKAVRTATQLLEKKVKIASPAIEEMKQEMLNIIEKNQ